MILHETLLAQVDWEQAGVFFGVCIAALGGTRGLERLIPAWRGRREPDEPPRDGDSKADRQKDSAFCAVHAEFAEKLNERHEAVMLAIGEIKQALVRLHDRIDLLLDRSPHERSYSHRCDQCDD